MPHMQRRGRRAAQEVIDSIGRSGQVRRTTFEMLPDDDARVQWIGQALKLHGNDWAARHPQHMRWLASRGVGRDEAVKRHEAWHAAEMQDPFWSQAKAKDKPVSRRKARRRARRGQ